MQVAAELSLSARVRETTQQGVRDALWRERSLVKAWTLRGTLHLHPADELPLWLAARRAVATRRPRELGEWRDPNGVVHAAVSSGELQEIELAVWEAMDGRCLLRDELAEEVACRVGPAHRARLLSGFAFFTDQLCQGPPQGSKVTFVRPDQWIRTSLPVDDEEALVEVCRRFLRTYGPARPADFRAWFGEASFDALDLEEVDVEGHRAFALAEDTGFPSPEPSLRLLPEYDAYVMGFREREHLVPGDMRELIAARGRGRYEGPAAVRFLAIDGAGRGLWERKKRGKALELTVTPTGTLTRASRAALEDEAARVAACLGAELSLTVE